MTVDELWGVTRASELMLAERTINQRAEWQALHKVEKLEKDLRVARTKLRFTFASETQQ